jgi:hypothetical protein
MKCCICDQEIDIQYVMGQVPWDQGHNAEPVREGRCCTICNYSIVIPTRMGLVKQRQKQTKMSSLLYELNTSKDRNE